MLCSVIRTFALVVILAAALLLAGCNSRGEVSLSPAPSGRSEANLGLGPGVRPITSGPGDKSSPVFSPDGNRVAYVVDGYVVDKPVNAVGSIRRWTTQDFGAENVQWLPSGEALAVMGSASDRTGPRSLYRAEVTEDMPVVSRIAANVLTATPHPAGGLLIAVGDGSSTSGLARVRKNGEVSRLYTGTVDGRITGISLAPDGHQAVLAVRSAEDPPEFELYTFDPSDGSSRRVARLKSGVEILGAPQWTTRGVYYVAGEVSPDEDAALYSLYRLGPTSRSPEPAPGVGEDFIALSLRASPDGQRLAIVGRRNPGSSTELYVLDPLSGDLKSLTSNEGMEIKTGYSDLTWSPEGKKVAIVARSEPSGPTIHSAPAEALVADFYNVYEVPLRGAG